MSKFVCMNWENDYKPKNVWVLPEQVCALRIGEYWSPDVREHDGYWLYYVEVLFPMNQKIEVTSWLKKEKFEGCFESLSKRIEDALKT